MRLHVTAYRVAFGRFHLFHQHGRKWQFWHHPNIYRGHALTIDRDHWQVEFQRGNGIYRGIRSRWRLVALLNAALGRTERETPDA